MRSWPALALFVLVLYARVSPVRHPLQPGRLYDVAVESSTATFDLPFREQNEQYLLVVANPSVLPEPQTVTFSAEPIDDVRLTPLSPVPSLNRATAPSLPRSSVRSNPSPAIAQREFWIPVTGGSLENPATYRRIVGKLAAEGRGVRVYVDRDDSVANYTIAQIVRRFPVTVRPKIEKYLGTARDIDGDGVLTVVLTGWLDRLEGGRAPLGGMVLPSDFRTDRPTPFSNRADVLYLNASVRPGRHLETLLAHELAHAVVASNRVAAGSYFFPATEEQSWLNEGMAHVAENLQSDNWSNLDYRVARFLAAPHATPLVVANYHDVGLWRDSATRGATYLFVRWCVDHFGVGLLPRLVDSRLTGVANVEAATRSRFDRLYRHFAAGLFLDTAGVHVTVATNEKVLPPLDLGKPLGAAGLCGPCFDAWDVSRGWTTPGPMPLASVAARHIVLSASHSGARRISVRAASASPLQVTLVRMPPTMARLNLAVTRSPQGAWEIRLAEQVGVDVQLSHVVWETDEPERLPPGAPTAVCLTEQRLSELFDDPLVPGSGTLVSRPIRFTGMPRGRLVVRTMGTDSDGHRVAAWTRVDLGRSRELATTRSQSDSEARISGT